MERTDLRRRRIHLTTLSFQGLNYDGDLDFQSEPHRAGSVLAETRSPEANRARPIGTGVGIEPGFSSTNVLAAVALGTAALTTPGMALRF